MSPCDFRPASLLTHFPSTFPVLEKFGGDEEDRTPDPLLARQVLSQLSYTPTGYARLQVRLRYSLKILYRPSKLNNINSKVNPCLTRVRNPYFMVSCLLRKEVIQPHLPIRLPCYDFTPVINPTFGGVLLAVRLPTSGVTDSHGVTGGVYKARERIHRGMLIRDY